MIGTGGMADVYRAVDETLGRTVAVKVMHARFAADPEFAARFRQEAQAVANLVSPQIVNMYDWGQDGDTYYLVMEYVRGSDLKRLEGDGALPSAKVAEIGAQVCSALSVAHGYDVIHRDVKPHNIMVQPDGSVKVMDFGIARAGNTTMTQTGSVLGTAQYISPEQAQGKPLTAASDLYSLGVVLYEAATGRLPFDADNPVAVALMQVNAQATPPHEVNPGIDPRLETVIVKAMQKSTADRYVSADDLRRDLRAVADGGARETAVMPLVADTAILTPVSSSAARTPRDGRSGSAARANARANARPDAKRRAVWPWMLAAAALVIAGFIAAPNVGLPGADRGVPVPDVGAKSSAAAKAALREAGFTVGTVTAAFSDRAESGLVTSQTPLPNATADKGSAVSLVLGKGPEMAAVPNVVGMAEADAFKALEQAGFSPQALPSEYSADVAANTVFKQEPAGAENAVRYSVVRYVVSRGPEFVAPGRDTWGKPGKSKDND